MKRIADASSVIASYLAGASIPIIATNTGIPRSTIYWALKSAGVLRARGDAVRLAASQGRVGLGWLGKKRPFTPAHREAIARSAAARGERTAAGVSLKPSGYVEFTRGEFKGGSQHRVIAEQAVGRPLLRHEVVHHKDHNRANNDPANLEVMSRAAHTSHHRKERSHGQGC